MTTKDNQDCFIISSRISVYDSMCLGSLSYLKCSINNCLDPCFNTECEQFMTRMSKETRDNSYRETSRYKQNTSRRRLDRDRAGAVQR